MIDRMCNGITGKQVADSPSKEVPGHMTTFEVEHTIRLRAAVNEWISEKFPKYRKYLSHSQPEYLPLDNVWSVTFGTKNINGHSVELGQVLVNRDGHIVSHVATLDIEAKIETLLINSRSVNNTEILKGNLYDFRLGDGIKGARALRDGEIDLLLTDPPYGISKSYTCEKQIPRRLRKDGRDFIMPKGNFGEWDKPINPCEWLNVVLPKVGGWAVSFCAQAQIGEYVECLSDHKFSAVGTLVWQKTNPVPFNHRFKPINAWEALVCGKRPGTKFNGRVVHNVFLYKSPSPQQRIHPTQKPLDLIREFVSLFSDEGDFIYDPFGGAGTTLIAASSQRRRVLSYEVNAEIFNDACARIQECL